jgi:hypothetical protein
MDIRSCAAHVCFWGKADIANGVRDTAVVEAAALRFLSPQRRINSCACVRLRLSGIRNVLGENSAIKRGTVCDVLIRNDACSSFRTNTWLRFSRPQMYSSPARQLDVAPDERPASFNDVLGIFRETPWQFRHGSTSRDCRSPNTPRRPLVENMSKTRLSSKCTAEKK